MDKNEQDASQDELLAAINAGFTRMEERFNNLEVAQRETNDRLASVQQIQLKEIEERDREQKMLENHEQRLQVLEGKPA